MQVSPIYGEILEYYAPQLKEIISYYFFLIEEKLNNIKQKHIELNDLPKRGSGHILRKKISVSTHDNP